MRSSFARFFAVLGVAGLVGCATTPSVTGPDIPARWNHLPEAAAWNAATMAALTSEGAAMLAVVPGDAATFCPGYARANTAQRAGVYVAALSVLARYESGWNPRAAGAGGRYRGLMQISPATARFHGCEGADLYDGAANLSCAVRIAARAVARDGVIATGRGGIAADWPPLRDAARRAEVASFTRALPQCAG